MRRRSIALTALIPIILLGTCLAANAQGVRFVTPEDGGEVRDMVRLQATKPSPDEGWISYKIERGGEGEFVAAVTPPFNYVWNTRMRDEQGKEIYPDGQYTLTAVALNPSGGKVGEAAITVTLKNAVSAADAPQRVDLSLAYDRNVEVYYRADGTWELSPAANEEDPEDAYEMAKSYNGALVANWKNKVMSPTIAAGHAVLHVVVGSAGAQAGESDVERLKSSGDVITYRALRDGEMRRKHDDDPKFELAEITIPLPGREVKVGDTWDGRIQAWPDPLAGTGAPAGGMEGMDGDMWMMGPGMDPMMGGMPGEMGMEGVAAAPASAAPTTFETTRVRAKHTVEGFEWVMGRPTVRIKSVFSDDKAKITIPSGPASGGVGGEMGEPFGGGMEEMGMFGDPGMGAGEMGMGGQGAEKDSSYVGERITYWSWELNRPLRIEDTITHTLEIDRAQQGMGAEFGMEGEFGGMGMEGMYPPGMDPRMGGPDMMDLGYGGGMMQQMEPAEPLKLRVQIKLTIQEVKR